MEELRNLTVGITLKDNATPSLIRVNDEIDDIRDNFQLMNANLFSLSAGFGQIGFAGSRAMDEIEDAAEDATKDFIAMGITGEIALNRIEDKADEAGDEIGDLGGKIKGTTARIASMGATIGLVSIGFSGAVAAAAPLIASVGGLASSFAAAGMGAVAFGAVAVPAINSVFEASEEVAKLQEKIANADNAEERIKAQKELAALYDDMSAAQREALNGLQGFKKFWSGFVKQFETPVFQTFTNGLKGVQGMLTGLQPTIQNVAGVFVELTNEFNQSLKGSGMQRFFDWLETNAAESLYNFAHIFGNTFMGIGNTLQAFAPMGASVEEGLVRMTQRFKEWTAGLSQSTSFQKFIEYAKENGPVLLNTLSNLWDIGVGLVKAFAPLGSEVLKGFQSLTDYVSTNVVPIISDVADKAAGFASTVRENWGPIKETVIGLGAAVGSFALMMKGLQIVGVINQLFAAWRAGTLMQTLAMWGLNASMLASPVTWIIGGIAALIGIGVLLYRNWDTIKAKAGELWASMREKWAGIKQSTSEAWGNVKTKIAEAMESAKTKVSNFFSPLLEFLRSAKEKWDSFVGALKNFKMPKIGLPKWAGGKGLIQLPSHATGLSRVPRDNYVANLHRDETILRADQARTLEQMGILDRSGVLPRLNLSAAQTPQPVAATVSSVRPVSFSPTIHINVQGGDKQAANNVKEAVKKAMEETWQNFLDIYAVEVVR
jgi:hypothetical protein